MAYVLFVIRLEDLILLYSAQLYEIMWLNSNICPTFTYTISIVQIHAIIYAYDSVEMEFDVLPNEHRMVNGGAIENRPTLCSKCSN